MTTREMTLVSTNLIVDRLAKELGLRVRRGSSSYVYASFEFMLPHETWVSHPISFRFDRHDEAYIEKTMRQVASNLKGTSAISAEVAV